MKLKQTIGFVNVCIEKSNLVILVILLYLLKTKGFVANFQAMTALYVLVEIFDLCYYLDQNLKLPGALWIFQVSEFALLFKCGFEQYLSKSVISGFISIPFLVSLAVSLCSTDNSLIVSLALGYFALVSIRTSILQTLMYCPDIENEDLKFYLRFTRETLFTCINQVGYVALIQEGFEHRSFIAFFCIFNGLALVLVFIIYSNKICKNTLLENLTFSAFCFYLIGFEGGIDITRVKKSYNIPQIKKYGYNLQQLIFKIQLLQKLFFFVLFLLLEYFKVMADDDPDEGDDNQSFTFIIAVLSSILMLCINGFNFIKRSLNSAKYIEIDNFQQLMKCNAECIRDRNSFKKVESVAFLLTLKFTEKTQLVIQELAKCLLYSFSNQEISFHNFFCFRKNTIFCGFKEQSVIFDNFGIEFLMNMKDDISQYKFLDQIREIVVKVEVQKKTIYEVVNLFANSNQFIYLKCNSIENGLKEIQQFYITQLRYVIKLQYIAFKTNLASLQYMNQYLLFYDLYE